MSHYPAPPHDAARGVDVSKYQGRIDWPAVAAAGYTFAVVRISDGVAHLDPMFARNLAGARAAGMEVAVYQFFRAHVPAEDQARVITEAVPPGTIVAHDLEDRDHADPWTVLARSRVWCDLVTESVRAPLLYSMPGFLNALTRETLPAMHVPIAELYQDLDLWIAHWKVSTPAVPDGWLPAKQPRVWQYASDAIVPGIAGPMDVNLWYGSEDMMRSYFKGETV